ncbi:MAG: hypothetical protein HYU74_09095 [Dechloromonas sp.]|nr:hypothetical protein [Dechloromonas sp.]
MGIHITAGCIEVAIGQTVTADANLILGPLQVHLGWAMFGATWEGRFDFICEKDGYRPEGCKWVGVWQESPEERGGYFVGWTWNLLTGSRAAGRR